MTDEVLRHRALKIRTATLIVVTVLCNALGNVLLSIGMKHVGDVRSWAFGSFATLCWRILTTSTIWIGTCTLVLFFVCYLLLLSWADYSYVQPATAVGYAVVPLVGHVVAGEPLSALRWSGVLLICLGVLLVGQTPLRTAARTTAVA